MQTTAIHPRPRPARSRALGAGLALLLLVGGTAWAGPVEDLQAVVGDYDRLLNRLDPIGAGQRGDLDAARRWPDDSPAAVKERLRAVTLLRDRLAAIPVTGLSGQDVLNHALLLRKLNLELDGARFDEERIPFNKIGRASCRERV